MAIDKSGKWWVGDDARDLPEYLTAFSRGRLLSDRVSASQLFLWIKCVSARN